ncbi:hypothetical protein F3Y22_tig00001262pilonHSYRG00015 [Hibiscus syriacus]|uniref:Uncharacterized protein n=1 Tax=Hibiscus syriacus TaxID=106335 RepID=A0A6A3D2D4_HIBSY|nr:hypothetical protein F3Y22_tig00001262pilonHSYRG00015 [Hibiscus syriacus]
MGSFEEEPCLLENGNTKGSSKENRHGKTLITMSSSLRSKSDLSLVSRVRCPMLRHFLANLQEVVLGTNSQLSSPLFHSPLLLGAMVLQD